MGLSAGGLICGGGGGGQGLYVGQRKASDRADIIRQNENLYLKNEENVSIIHLFTH